MKTKFFSIVFLAVIFSLFHTMTARAWTEPEITGHKQAAGSKVSFTINTEADRKVDHKDCNYPGWHPQLSYYLDGDGPEDTAYSDYLEDLGWWQAQYPNACQITPEPIPS